MCFPVLSSELEGEVQLTGFQVASVVVWYVLTSVNRHQVILLQRCCIGAGKNFLLLKESL